MEPIIWQRNGVEKWFEDEDNLKGPSLITFFKSKISPFLRLDNNV